MRRAATSLVALAYCLASLALAAWAALIAEFHCYDANCDESASDWKQAHEAWQWDAIIWLGLLSGLAALVTLALLAPRRALVPAVGLGFHAALLVPTVGLLAASDQTSAEQAALYAALVLGLGAAAIYLRNAAPSAPMENPAS